MLYVNGECFGLTPEEIRTMLGSPDVEPSKRRRRRFRLRKAARKTLVAAGTVFVTVILPLMMFVSCTGGRAVD